LATTAIKREQFYLLTSAYPLPAKPVFGLNKRVVNYVDGNADCSKSDGARPNAAR